MKIFELQKDSEILDIKNVDNESDSDHDIEEDDEELIKLGKNDFDELLEDADRGSKLLLDRLLKKSNLDDYKYIINDIRKKMKRAEVSGDLDDIKNLSKYIGKKNNIHYPKD